MHSKVINKKKLLHTVRQRLALDDKDALKILQHLYPKKRFTDISLIIKQCKAYYQVHTNKGVLLFVAENIKTLSEKEHK